MASPLLRTQNLTFAYQQEGPRVLDGVELAVESGSITALVGPSGSGKTTLLKLLAGLWSPSEGEAYIGKEAISPYALELIPGFPEAILVHQDYQLPGHQSLWDSFRWPLRYWEAEDQKREIHHLMQVLGLEGLENRKPTALSGGQQQRAALALGLLENPTVLLLDEPFSHVDAPRRRQLRQEIRRRVSEEGLTVIFTTHEPEDALVLSDQVGLLAAGKLVQSGTPEAVYHRPVSEVAAGLLGPYNRIASLREPKEELGFRPIAVQIQAEGPYSGTVTQVEVFGPYSLLSLELPSGESILASHPFPLALGERVSFSLRDDWVVNQWA